MRIAVLDQEKCQIKKCSYECINFCPRVRAGDETIIKGEDGKPIISEDLCVGCNICVRKCPFDAISIINLPEELGEEAIHRYGKNGFALYRLPIPGNKGVTGILGPNGIGKTTAAKILTGKIKPNLGSNKNQSWEEIADNFAGSALQQHFKNLEEDDIKVSLKPQYIDEIPNSYDGKVKNLLKKFDESERLDDIIKKIGIDHITNRNIGAISGGELQRVAIAGCLSRDADLYILDEITPYLDIYQRINVSRVIQKLSEEKPILIIEHDLAILDLLADSIHLSYGEPSVYGIISQPKGTRRGINQYLTGFLPDENLRIREESIEFEKGVSKEPTGNKLLEFPSVKKCYERFEMEIDGGNLYKGETIGVVGPNAIGKSTMMKMFAGKVKPTIGEINLDIKISYKPQYLETSYKGSVESFLRDVTSKNILEKSYYKTRILEPLSIKNLLNLKIKDLSGGELQRVAIASCLSRDADLYILDEPSAHLDVEQRTMATKTIRGVTSDSDKTSMIVDHDIYMIDLLSDRIMVFEGDPSSYGVARGPFKMRGGMNLFLKNLGITFRRDEDSNRPRINKEGSKLDREQKKVGEYYYNYN